MRSGKGLIITADDFGRHPAINAAVEQGYREGVLDCASLMVGAPYLGEALEVARRNPGLRVGLHLVLSDGHSVLPKTRIPDLVDAQGCFPQNAMARDGCRFFLLPRVRQQLAAEIRAQFEAFEVSGLTLDHANAHRHFHLHPTVLSLMLSIGKEFGLKAMRLPLERGRQGLLAPWLLLLRWRMRRAGVSFNDQIFGLSQSGAMGQAALMSAIKNLAEGVTEIYLHPAVGHSEPISSSMANYQHSEELAALCSQEVRQALENVGPCLGGFQDLFPVGEE